MSGFKIHNVDLDDILQMKSWFATSGSTYTSNTGFKIGGSDIKNRYAKIDISPNNLTVPATGYKTNTSDLNTIFSKENEVYPDRFVKVEIWGGRGTWETNNYTPSELTSSLWHYRDHGRHSNDTLLFNGAFNGYVYDLYFADDPDTAIIESQRRFGVGQQVDWYFCGCGAKQTSYHVLNFSSGQNYYIVKGNGGSGGTASSGRNAGYGGNTLALAKKSSDNSASDIVAVAGAGGGAGSGNGILGALAYSGDLRFDQSGTANDNKPEYVPYTKGNKRYNIDTVAQQSPHSGGNPAAGSAADQNWYNSTGQHVSYADWAYGINAKHWWVYGGGGGWANVGWSGGGGGGLLNGGNGGTADGGRRSSGGGGGGAGMYGGGGGGAHNTGEGGEGSPGGGSGSSFAERTSLVVNSLSNVARSHHQPSVLFDPKIIITYYAMENRSTPLHTEKKLYSAINNYHHIPRI